jgi:hypothetical protein
MVLMDFAAAVLVVLTSKPDSERECEVTLMRLIVIFASTAVMIGLGLAFCSGSLRRCGDQDRGGSASLRAAREAALLRGDARAPLRGDGVGGWVER